MFVYGCPYKASTYSICCWQVVDAESCCLVLSMCVYVFIHLARFIPKRIGFIRGVFSVLEVDRVTSIGGTLVGETVSTDASSRLASFDSLMMVGYCTALPFQKLETSQTMQPSSNPANLSNVANISNNPNV